MDQSRDLSKGRVYTDFKLEDGGTMMTFRWVN